ncbi:hypothetical protein GW17_00049361 [Ensete ventricosum]|nr:hypothetical protein GW17_00049361 [Ensete ventricosum]
MTGGGRSAQDVAVVKDLLPCSVVGHSRARSAVPTLGRLCLGHVGRTRNDSLLPLLVNSIVIRTKPGNDPIKPWIAGSSNLISSRPECDPRE